MEEIMVFRKIVMPRDLNSANNLFGGRMMEWMDEAAGTYAICQLKTSMLVTLKVSELLFKNPARNGDIVEFFCKTAKVGKTSFTVQVSARTKEIMSRSKEIVTGEIVFVAIDIYGKPTRHILSPVEL